MKLTPTKLTIGSRINRALRSLLMLIVYLFLGLGCFGILAFFILFGQYDKEVTPKFENRRWALPARVYARPLELFKDAQITPEQIIGELTSSNYQSSSNIVQSGSYFLNANQLDIYTRAFTFSDGQEPSRKLRVSFNNNRIEKVEQLSPSEELSLVRIEPVEIGAIYPAHNEDRILVKFDDIPSPLVDALIAMEDRAFYSHIGINPKAILRAVINNLQGNKMQGASTLTQQLVKNYFLTPERSLKRKMEEAMYSLVIDYRYPKNDILEAYANEIYLGQDGSRAIHGFGLASMFYFGRPLNELTLNDMALLVGIIPSPSSYNPRRHPEKGIARRNLVLDVMVSRNLISKKDADDIKRLPLNVLQQPPSGITKFPAFLDLVNKQLKQLYKESDLSTQGLKIFTTLNPIIQAQAEKSLTDTLPVLEKSVRQPKNSLQGAIIIAKNQTGEIEALVGDRNSRQAGFNRALDAKRQIGSLIKPIIYLRALETPDRYSLATPLNDSDPFSMMVGGKNWSPKNYDQRLHGYVPLITALAKSYNIPTVRLGMDISLNEIAQTLYRLGLDNQQYSLKPTPALLLGAIDMTPFDLTQIYSTIANEGYRTPLIAIREVTAANGETLARSNIDPVIAIYSGPNYLITKAMQEVVNAGTASKIKATIKVEGLAGKTGTTNDYRDSWFSGFSGDRIATVWIGRDDNNPIKLSGSTGALQLWIATMKNIPLEARNLTVPDDISMVNIDTGTGLLANPNCLGAVKSQPFVKGYEPKDMGECLGDSYWEDGDSDPASERVIFPNELPAGAFQ